MMKKFQLVALCFSVLLMSNVVLAQGPCSGLTTLMSAGGSFSDGSGAGNYQNNQSCEWLIQPAVASSITLSFSSFQLESGFDFVSIYDGTNAAGTLLGQFSGSTIPTSVTATSGAMYVTFSTNGSITSDGFEAFFVSCTDLTWGQMQLGNDIEGESVDDYSGVSVSMPDANVVAVGAPYNDANGTNAGSVRVHSWNGTSWLQLGLDIDGEAIYDNSGWSVSMPDVNTVAIGANRNDGNGSNAGHVRVYSWSGNGWIQKGLDIDGEAAGDESGYSVSMPDANTVAIGAISNDGNGRDAGHVRVYSWNGVSWVQKGLDIDGEAAFDGSGYSVSMPDANTIAIGATGNDRSGNSSGHVRVYRWNGSGWVQKGIDVDGEAAYDKSGWSVSMPDSNTLAIGAPQNAGVGYTSGHVRVYEWSGINWVQKGTDIDGETLSENFGYSVSMPDANTVAVGVRRKSENGVGAGQVRIYNWDGANWIQKGLDFNGEAAGDESGYSVSMPDANTLAIGAPKNDKSGNDAGHVRIYQLLGQSSKPVASVSDRVVYLDSTGYASITAAYINEGSTSVCEIDTMYLDVYDFTCSDLGENYVTLTVVDIKGISATATATVTVKDPLKSFNWAQLGNDIDGEAEDDGFGSAVSMPDANTVAIGAPWNGAGNIGHVRVYTLSNAGWVQKGNDIDGEAAGDQSGLSISMPDANTLAIGARENDGNGTGSGHVRVYQWNGTRWAQKGLDIDGEAPFDQSGYSVSMPDANTIAIGARNNDGNGSNAGHVRIYSWSGNGWIQKGLDIEGESGSDQSGYSVSMPDANTVAIGATQNDGSGYGAGHVRVYIWDGTNWLQKGMDIDGESAGDQSGYSVSMPDANTVAIGAPYNDGNGTDAGHVRIYSWNGEDWMQKGLDIEGKVNSGQTGWSVSMPDVNTIAIGSPFNGYNIVPAGYVSVYNWTSNGWGQIDLDIVGEAARDQSGWSVSMSDANTLGIGANSYKGNISKSGHVKIYQLVNNSLTASVNDTTLFLDSDGEVFITTSMFYDSSKLNACKDSVYLDTYSFSCNSLGQQLVTLTITNKSGNSNSASATVTVLDTISPIVVGYSLTVYLDGNGQANITANQADSASSDNCGIASLSLDLDSFTCQDVGQNSVVLTAFDSSGNAGSDNFVVFVLDTISPTVIAKDSTLYLDANGEAFLEGISIDDGSSDNCGIQSMYGTIEAFDCSHIGSNMVYLVVEDNNGNIDSALYKVEVIDTIRPAVTQAGALLTAVDVGVQYQWLDCDKSYSPINGATSQTYQATGNGNYAVEIDNGLCLDTSDCYAVMGVGMEITEGIVNGYQLYPNPNEGDFIIQNATGQPYDLSIIDISGRVIYQEFSVAAQSHTISLTVAAGMYMAIIRSGNTDTLTSIRFVKE